MKKSDFTTVALDKIDSSEITIMLGDKVIFKGEICDHDLLPGDKLYFNVEGIERRYTDDTGMVEVKSDFATIEFLEFED